MPAQSPGNFRILLIAVIIAAFLVGGGIVGQRLARPNLVGGQGTPATTSAASASSRAPRPFPTVSPSSPSSTGTNTTPTDLATTGPTTKDPTTTDPTTTDGTTTDPTTADPTTGGVSSTAAARATSLADFGGMAGLVEAADAEGALNVIALPPDWANYSAVIAGFQEKYPEIKLTSLRPDASSAEEIKAADTSVGTDQEPDVFDISQSVTAASTSYFAPYRVAAWKDIPAANKEATGLWFNDYSGVMMVGYNADVTPNLTSLAQLTSPLLKGKVMLDGDPTRSSSAMLAVTMAAVANGGSPDDLSRGVAYFKSLKTAGTLISSTSVSGIAAKVTSAEVGALIDWSYEQQTLVGLGVNWKTFVPKGASLGGYYSQAVNRNAPHPAAARLWEEYIYTAQAQNLFIAGGAVPVLYRAMKSAHTLQASSGSVVPDLDAPIRTLSTAQASAAFEYLTAAWPQAMGG